MNPALVESLTSRLLALVENGKRISDRIADLHKQNAALASEISMVRLRISEECAETMPDSVREWGVKFETLAQTEKPAPKSPAKKKAK